MRKNNFLFSLFILGVIVLPYIVVFLALPVFKLSGRNLLWWLIASVSFWISGYVQKRIGSENDFFQLALATNGLLKSFFSFIFVIALFFSAFYRVSITDQGQIYTGKVVAVQQLPYARGIPVSFDIKLEDGTVIRDSLSPNLLRKFTCVAEGLSVGDSYEIITFRYFGLLMTNTCRKIVIE